MNYDRNKLSKTCLDNYIEYTENSEKKTFTFSCSKDFQEDLTEEILNILPKGVEAHFIVGPSKATQKALDILIKESHFQGNVKNERRNLIFTPVKEMKDSFTENIIALINSDDFFDGVRFIMGDEEIYYNKAVEREKENNKTDRKKITQRDELAVRMINERELDVLDFIKAISI